MSEIGIRRKGVVRYLAHGLLISFFFIGYAVCDTIAKADDNVQWGDQYIEFVRTKTYAKYRFTSKSIPEREKRLVYNYILDKLINGDFTEASAVVSELLPTEQDRAGFLEAVYKVVDSVVWEMGMDIRRTKYFLTSRISVNRGFPLRIKPWLAMQKFAILIDWI